MERAGGDHSGRYWFRGRFSGYGGGYRGGCLGYVFFAIIICAVLAVISTILVVVNIFSPSESYDTYNYVDIVEDMDMDEDMDEGMNEDDDYYDSSYSRSGIESDFTFDSDCIIDELGWFDDVEATGEALEDFFNATGIQPLIYFKAYDSSLKTNSQKEDYACDYYDDNIDNEITFLFVYFAEKDADNEIGYMVYVTGYDIEDVMDDEAIEIFWNYVDKYWYSDLSTDDMIIKIFNSLADAIM